MLKFNYVKCAIRENKRKYSFSHFRLWQLLQRNFPKNSDFQTQCSMLNGFLAASWSASYTFYCIGPDFELHEWTRKKKSIHFAQSFPQHFPLYAHFYTLIYRWRNYERAYKVYCEIYFLLTSFYTFRGLRWIAAMKFCGKCAHHNKCEKICVSNEITALLLSR